MVGGWLYRLLPGQPYVAEDEVTVMFKRCPQSDEQAAIERGWAELEQSVGSLRGRKFFGTFDPCDPRVPRLRAAPRGRSS